MANGSDVPLPKPATFLRPVAYSSSRTLLVLLLPLSVLVVVLFMILLFRGCMCVLKNMKTFFCFVAYVGRLEPISKGAGRCVISAFCCWDGFMMVGGRSTLFCTIRGRPNGRGERMRTHPASSCISLDPLRVSCLCSVRGGFRSDIFFYLFLYPRHQ